MKIIFVDFDGTLTAPRRDDLVAVVFNEDLIARLVEKQNAGAIIIGFTSYLLEFNLAQNLRSGNTRQEIICHCAKAGLNFDSILTTASPYAEVIKDLGFGGYYESVIKSIEDEALKASLDNRQEVVDKYLNAEETFLSNDLEKQDPQVAGLRKQYRIFGKEDQYAYRKGKEEMFRYAIPHFLKKYAGSDLEFEVYDDDRKVIDVAKALKDKEGVRIAGNLVEFYHDIPVSDINRHSVFAPCIITQSPLDKAEFVLKYDESASESADTHTSKKCCCNLM